MIIYQYDGSFEGLITCFYYAIKNKENPKFVKAKSPQISFLDIAIDIESDMEIYNKMQSYIIDTATFDCFNAIYTAYLNDNIDINDELFYFLKKSFKHKEQTVFMRTDNKLNEVISNCNKVQRESHKMLGFIRFKKINDSILYSEYQPTYNITSLVSPHFCDRFRDYHFVINDSCRKIYAIYDTKKCIIGEYAENSFKGNLEIKDEYDHFFRTYHQHIAIPERKNLKLQMNLMPKKYWSYITEMLKE